MFAEFGKVLDSVKAVQLGKHELEVGVTHVDVVSRGILSLLMFLRTSNN